jgi:CheY-like chemotaxis protein
MVPNNHTGDGRKSETILLVEDQPSVRRLLSQTLLLNGYEVLEAADGLEAIQIVDQHAHPIDLLLTDVVMPNLNGGELARRVAEKRPEMRVLFTSGYMDDSVVKGIVSTGAQFLPKPFSPGTLLQKVRNVLDEPWRGLSFHQTQSSD